MSMQASFATPPKMQIALLDDPTQFLEAQFNPEELVESGGADWARAVVPGLSHKIKQFINTKDRTLKFTLRFIANAYPSNGPARLKAARRFILANSNPVAMPGDVGHGGAPQLLFLWPNYFSMTAVIDTWTIKSQRFTTDNQPADLSIEVGLEQIRAELLTSDMDPDT